MKITDKIDSVIISDVHLGTEVSHVDLLLDELHKLLDIGFNRLILNGDIFEDLNFIRLKKPEWKFLSILRKLTENEKLEIIFIEGNHDILISNIISHLIGVKVVKEYEW